MWWCKFCHSRSQILLKTIVLNSVCSIDIQRGTFNCLLFSQKSSFIDASQGPRHASDISIKNFDTVYNDQQLSNLKVLALRNISRFSLIVNMRCLLNEKRQSRVSRSSSVCMMNNEHYSISSNITQLISNITQHQHKHTFFSHSSHPLIFWSHVLKGVIYTIRGY